ncbi:MAG TPA: hypothetical protein VGN20_15985 [Mucilaginibacter sp.]
MEWYNYLALFFSGAFLANAIPHFVQGVSGNKFPSPFSKPPGKGLSSPLVNVLWGGLNIVIGYVLLKAGKFSPEDRIGLIVFFAGAMIMSVQLGINFSKKDKE